VKGLSRRSASLTILRTGESSRDIDDDVVTEEFALAPRIEQTYGVVPVQICQTMKGTIHAVEFHNPCSNRVYFEIGVPRQYSEHGYRIRLSLFNKETVK
jgi:hypothetical protein